MLKKIHPISGIVALLTIATFWLSTAFVELFASQESVTLVKTAIPWGLLLLIPALALTGGSGFKLSQGRRVGLVAKKLKRMPFIALNGLLILVPAALYLASKARLGEFDTGFYIVQAIELVAGAANIVLIIRSAKDGQKLTKNRKLKSA